MGSVKEEITRLETAKKDIETAIETCGVNVPDTELIDTYASYIRQIPSAVFSGLNVDPVGGADQFIQSIKQTNGLIEATVGGLVSTSNSGLVPKADGSAGVINSPSDDYVLTYKGGTIDWYKLPANAFKNDDNNTTYTLSGTLNGNAYNVTLTPSSGSATGAKVPAMGAASSSAAGTAGLVPAPAKNKHNSFLRGDGTWAVPDNTTYSVMTGATASAAGKSGLVPQPAKGDQGKFLSGAGTWTALPSLSITDSESGNAVTDVEVSGHGITLKRGTTFSVNGHKHSSDDITALTSYIKATAASAIASTDSLNTALGKLELKADTAYNLVKGAYDGDGTIENLAEILKVLEGIKDTETIQAIIGKYLPLSGGIMTGALDLTNSPNSSDRYKMGATNAGHLGGGIHFKKNGANDWGQAITWSHSDETSHAGIYVKSSGAYGTKMYLCTTNLFVDGAKAALEIDASGKITALRNNFVGNLTGKASTADSATIAGDGTMTIVPKYNNEINFGGTNASSTLYFGYRATGSKPIPTAFVFGGSSGSASITASKFIKSGGTSSQFLKADGSVDSNTYLTALPSHNHDYIPFEQSVNGKDMDTIKTTGFYYGYTMTNSAHTAISSFIVAKYSPDWGSQLQLCAGNQRAYVRYWQDAGGVMKSWYTLAYTSDIPTKTSQLTNDSGFLTSHQSLANYVTLNTAQTISATKTFSAQQSFTATGKAPFTVSSDVKVDNLNADFVDGYHVASLFKRLGWNSNTTYTDANTASMPFGLMINQQDNYSSVIKNYPTGYGYLLNLSTGDESNYSGVQIYTNYNSSRTYIRSKWGSTWYDWKTLAYTSDIPTSLKSPGTLTLSAGTFSAKTYDGSADVTVNIPTHTSHLTNNSSFMTETDVNNKIANFITRNVNTNTNANPFIVSRLGGTVEALKIGVDDSTAHFVHEQDETVSDFLFKGKFNDTAQGGGKNAGEKTIRFGLSSSDHNIYVGSSTVLHAGNYTSYTVKKDGTGASGTWGINISGTANYANSAGDADTLDGINSSGFLRQVTQNATFSSVANISTDLVPGIHSIHIGGVEYSSILTGRDYYGSYWQLYFHPSSGYTQDIKYRATNCTTWKTLLDSNNWSSFITIPSVGNGTVTINQGGVNKGSFTLNQSTAATIDLTDTNYYPTAFSWSGGTTAGPTGSLTGVGMTAVSFGAIPEATGSASGIVTTAAQSFAGVKTFTGKVELIGGGSGSTSITCDKAALVIGTMSRTGSTGEYYPGIAFNHMYGYGGGSSYRNHAHAWIGLRLESTPGSELSSLIFATQSTTTTGTALTERMCITSGGTVGIGTSSPSTTYKLYVAGKTFSSSLYCNAIQDIDPEYLLFYAGRVYKAPGGASCTSTYGMSGFSITYSRNRSGRYIVTLTNNTGKSVYIHTPTVIPVFGDWGGGSCYESPFAYLDHNYSYEYPKLVSAGKTLQFTVICGSIHTQGNWSTGDFTKSDDDGGFSCCIYGSWSY